MPKRRPKNLDTFKKTSRYQLKESPVGEGLGEGLGKGWGGVEGGLERSWLPLLQTTIWKTPLTYPRNVCCLVIPPILRPNFTADRFLWKIGPKTQWLWTQYIYTYIYIFIYSSLTASGLPLGNPPHIRSSAGKPKKWGSRTFGEGVQNGESSRSQTQWKRDKPRTKHACVCAHTHTCNKHTNTHTHTPNTHMNMYRIVIVATWWPANIYDKCS